MSNTAKPRKVFSLTLIRQRESDPQAAIAAQRRADVVTERLAPKRGAIKTLMQSAYACADPDGSIRLIRQALAIVGSAMHNVAPCNSGCSNCCYQPVMIVHAEADLIGREIGRPAGGVQYTLERNNAYQGTACPFLKKDRCTIYASRPLVCRMQYSMSNDEVLCQIMPGESITVPYYNLVPLQIASMMAIGVDAAFTQGDLRDYFPEVH